MVSIIGNAVTSRAISHTSGFVGIYAVALSIASVVLLSPYVKVITSVWLPSPIPVEIEYGITLSSGNSNGNCILQGMKKSLVFDMAVIAADSPLLINKALYGSIQQPLGRIPKSIESGTLTKFGPLTVPNFMFGRIVNNVPSEPESGG